MAELSIIIPTYNRESILRKCLAALARQTIGKERFEVLVCDDGSDRSPENVIAEMDDALDLAFIRQDRAGPAAARNKGIRAAKSDLLLFMNDDAIADESLLENHLKARNSPDFPHAVLGSFRLDPNHALTPLGHLSDTTGALFGYHGLTKGALHEYDHFYTCNISLPKRHVMDAGMFDERFKGPAAEDIDLGYRLGKAGIKVCYRPECRTLHDHPMTLEGMCRTNEMRGFWAVDFFLKHPDVPRGALKNGNVHELKRKFIDREKDHVRAAHERIEPDLSRTEPAPVLRAEIAGRHAADFTMILQHHYRSGLLDNPRFDQAVRAVRDATRKSEHNASKDRDEQ